MKRAFLIFVFLTLQILVISVCLAETLVFSNPKWSLVLFNGNSEALIGQNQALHSSGMHLDHLDDIKRNAESVIKLAPLNGDAFFHLALVEFWKTDGWVSSSVLKEAERRAPRNITLVRVLLGLDLVSGEYDSAISRVNLLLKLDPSKQDQYFEVLFHLSETSDGLIALKKNMHTDVSWSNRLLRYKIGRSTSANIFEQNEFVRLSVDSSRSLERTSMVEKIYLNRLVHFGHINAAHSFWKETAGPKTSSYFNIHDSRFKGLPGSPPFNWSVYNGPKITMDMDSAGGLYVSYSGSRRRKITSQLVKVAGDISVSLSVSAKWNYKEREGSFEWRAKCWEKQNLIKTITLDDAGKMLPNLQGSFVVPNECNFIDLQLWAIPGKDMTRLSVTIHEVKLTAVSR